MKWATSKGAPHTRVHLRPTVTSSSGWTSSNSSSTVRGPQMRWKMRSHKKGATHLKKPAFNIYNICEMSAQKSTRWTSVGSIGYKSRIKSDSPGYCFSSHQAGLSAGSVTRISPQAIELSYYRNETNYITSAGHLIVHEFRARPSQQPLSETLTKRMGCQNLGKLFRLYEHLH